MKLRRRKYLAVCIIGLLGASCSKIPGYVIDTDDMAALLADIHIGESVVDLNKADYRTDSLKQVMLQSVLAKHGVSKHDLDTSFDWYGHNITYYMEVYDKTIEILERRLAETGNRIAAENISIAGDSVDIWNGASFVAVNRLSPSQFITFSISNDENWEKGDSYTWRAKFTNNSGNSIWALVADYTDGSKDLLTADLGGEGWQELRFITDSTKTASHIYGYISAATRGATTMWADSIMLIRNRLSAETYNQHYRLQGIKPKNLKTENIVAEGNNTDSING